MLTILSFFELRAHQREGETEARGEEVANINSEFVEGTEERRGIEEEEDKVLEYDSE